MSRGKGKLAQRRRVEQLHQAAAEENNREEKRNAKIAKRKGLEPVRIEKREYAIAQINARRERRKALKQAREEMFKRVASKSPEHTIRHMLGYDEPEAVDDEDA
jgi:hypothetical protein